MRKEKRRLQYLKRKEKDIELMYKYADETDIIIFENRMIYSKSPRAIISKIVRERIKKGTATINEGWEEMYGHNTKN
tara:strand:+ start:113 stop:343 length:231 start_codon:yes stop_codon:yes gene_type:complete